MMDFIKRNWWILIIVFVVPAFLIAAGFILGVF